MMRGRVALSFFSCAFILSFLSGCQATFTALETGRLASSADAAKLVVVGEGRYAYQFTLIDPHNNKPWPNHPYALTTGRHNHYHLPFVTDAKNVYQGVSDGEGKTALFRLPVRISDQDWDLRERFGSGPNGETFRLLIGNTGKPLANSPYLLMICSTPPQYHFGYSYPNGDTAYSASDKPERITLSHGGSSDKNDLPKSCDEPEDTTSAVPASAGDTMKEPSQPLEPAAAAEPSKDLRRILVDLMKRGDDALQAKDYPRAKTLFEQADSVITKHESAFRKFAGYYGRAELQVHLAMAIGDGKLGDPCLAIARAHGWAAKAKIDTTDESENERRDEADALMGRIAAEAKRLGCPIGATMGKPNGQ